MNNDFPKNREVIRATLGELSDAYKHAQWDNSYKYNVIKKFLNIDDIKNITSTTRIVGQYEQRIITAVLYDYLQKNNYVIEQAFNPGENGPYPHEYVNIEVGYKETKRVMSEGTLYLRLSTIPAKKKKL
jgi:hypothetical protein